MPDLITPRKICQSPDFGENLKNIKNRIFGPS